MSYKLKMKLAPWCFITPFLIVFVLFAVYPVLYSIVLSFGTYKGGTVNFSGIKNYMFLLSDKSFFQSSPHYDFSCHGTGLLSEFQDGEGKGIFQNGNLYSGSD